ncbi:MAG TPA: hypothetical protein VGN17_05130 [Bryobacteraceae bacterium]|jgi:hypothetical protein
MKKVNHWLAVVLLAFVSIVSASAQLYPPVQLFDECTTPAAIHGFNVVNSGTGAAQSQVAGTALRPGIVQLSTGTTTSGYSYRGTGDSNSVSFTTPGSGVLLYETAVNIPTLPDGTDSAGIREGFLAGTSGDNNNDICFKYTNASTHLICRTDNAGTATTTTLGSAYDPVAGTFQKLAIRVDEKAKEVNFYVNDVLVATHKTNIPTAAVGAGVSILKTAGTTARTVQVDYQSVKYFQTTLR